MVISGLTLIPLRWLLGLSSTGILLAQAIGPDIVDSARKVTFDVALLIAIIVLWKALVDLTVKCDARIAEKDKQIYELGIKSVESSLMFVRAIGDFKEVVKELKDTIRINKIP